MKKKMISIIIIGMLLCACGSYREKNFSASNAADKEKTEQKATTEKAEECKEKDDDKEEIEDHFPDINTEAIPYSYVVVDQDVYPDLDSLLQVSDLIFKGKVVDHTYVVKSEEFGIPVKEKVDSNYVYIVETEYKIEIEKVYKGTESDSVTLNFSGVPLDFEKDKQIRVMKEAAEILGSDEQIRKLLPAPEAWNDFRVEDGNEYLFCLRECNGTWITVDYGQGIYRLDDPTIKDHWGYLSAEEILKVFE